MQVRYFEDFEPGESFQLGSRTVTASDIVAFAQRYDPQRFHVDREAATETIFGDLVASGWHTGAVCTRLLVDELLADTAVVGAVGVDDLRWWSPVYGGDELHVTATVAGKEPWDDSKGILEVDVEARSDGEKVHSRLDLILIERRNAA